jgi:hypothetical protein
MNVPPGNHLVTVDPERMLTVTLQYPGQPVQVNAIACRYIAATVQAGTTPRRVVAVEVIRDPMTPIPLQAYHCNANLLEVIRLPANALIHVRPYVPYPELIGPPQEPPYPTGFG